MATTKSLNSKGTVWCTTYYDRTGGTMHNLTVVHNGRRISKPFNEAEMYAMLIEQQGADLSIPDNGVRPEFNA